MMNKYVQYKQSKRSLKRKASEGMTAAIILIAFIITAAGIAFVILTMGSDFQNSLSDTGNKGKDAASSAIQVEGNIVTGYGEDVAGNIKVVMYTFDIKLVLGNGKVDLNNASLTLTIIIGAGDVIDLVHNNSITEISEMRLAQDNSYNIRYYNGDGDDLLEPNEVGRIFIRTSTAGSADDNVKVRIILMTEVALINIEKIIRVGVEVGSNLL